MKNYFTFSILLFIISCNKNTESKKDIDKIVATAVAKAMDSVTKKNIKIDSVKTEVKAPADANEYVKVISTKELTRLAKKHFQSYKNRLLSKNTAIGLLDTYTGDFTNDGKEDVVLYYSIEPTDGGNYLAGQGLALYKNVSSNIEFIRTFDADYLFVMDKINNGKIFIKNMEYAEDDPRCCPSIETSISLTVNGNKITQKKE
ncbi:hypothetical protein [Riemerella anatipestifer]|uniref:hypothetical protein n=1 Tax=Riemerella anatipestifer TaxID=34085 RepID=UPI00129DF8F7|nr:hypothetical protein [Riemerella anatipestifer]MDY3339523.1 hypothetical protein [Riemerella anatipestifer]MRM84315.1 hypothetical protein [Riemerella anatipestifer]